MAAEAEQKRETPLVGVLTPAESEETPAFQEFRSGLDSLGYVEGRSIKLEFRFARGHNDRLPELAAELLNIGVDVIVADTTMAARAAWDVTRLKSDPDRSGGGRRSGHPWDGKEPCASGRQHHGILYSSG